MLKPAAFVVCVAFLSILYVNQHANLIECSYAINNSNETLGLLIDRNNTLRYNISKLESPLSLDNKIQKEMQAYDSIPLDSFTITIERPAVVDSTIVPKMLPSRIPAILLSMFALDNEAVAKELSD